MSRTIFVLLFLSFAVPGCMTQGSLSSVKRMEDSILYQPRPYPEGNWEPKDLPHEDAWFQSDDGVRLHGWYCQAERPRAVVLLCHGNGGNLTSCAWPLKLLRDKFGVSVLVFDYRGYGRSEGKPSEAGLLADARASRRWLAKRANVAEKDVVLMGFSLGGAVAVDLAAKDGARGLIIQSTFTSVPEVAAKRTHVPGIGSLMTAQLNSLELIGKYHGPLLQCHGDADRIIPFALGKKLFDAANEPKQFIVMHGLDHNDPPSLEFMQAIDRFFDRLPRQTLHYPELRVGGNDLARLGIFNTDAGNGIGRR